VKTGDKQDVPLTFPADYHAKDLAGQEVVFEVTVKRVSENALPELNDELAAKAGPFTSLQELTDDIKKEIAAQKDREATDSLKGRARAATWSPRARLSVPSVASAKTRCARYRAGL
jgi:trigger factor